MVVVIGDGEEVVAARLVFVDERLRGADAVGERRVRVEVAPQQRQRSAGRRGRARRGGRGAQPARRGAAPHVNAKPNESQPACSRYMRARRADGQGSATSSPRGRTARASSCVSYSCDAPSMKAGSKGTRTPSGYHWFSRGSRDVVAGTGRHEIRTLRRWAGSPDVHLLRRRRNRRDRHKSAATRTFMPFMPLIFMHLIVPDELSGSESDDFADVRGAVERQHRLARARPAGTHRHARRRCRGTSRRSPTPGAAGRDRRGRRARAPRARARRRGAPCTQPGKPSGNVEVGIDRRDCTRAASASSRSSARRAGRERVEPYAAVDERGGDRVRQAELRLVRRPRPELHGPRLADDRHLARGHAALDRGDRVRPPRAAPARKRERAVDVGVAQVTARVRLEADPRRLPLPAQRVEHIGVRRRADERAVEAEAALEHGGGARRHRPRRAWRRKTPACAAQPACRRFTAGAVFEEFHQARSETAREPERMREASRVEPA